MKKAKVEREPLEEIDLLDSMHSALVDLLIKKGIITEEEYEKRIKQRVKIKSPKAKRSHLCRLVVIYSAFCIVLVWVFKSKRSCLFLIDIAEIGLLLLQDCLGHSQQHICFLFILVS